MIPFQVQLAAPTLSPVAISHAVQALTCSAEQPRQLMIADMSLPSSEPRLWVFRISDDGASVELIKTTFVAHGVGSDPGHTGQATRFSNAPGSDMTSLGLYEFGSPYIGKHGKSYRLLGLSHSDSNAFERAVVFHPAPYVRLSGVVGRSNGCPAINPAEFTALDKTFGGMSGAVLWIDGPGAKPAQCSCSEGGV